MATGGIRCACVEDDRRIDDDQFLVWIDRWRPFVRGGLRARGGVGAGAVSDQERADAGERPSRHAKPLCEKMDSGSWPGKASTGRMRRAAGLVKPVCNQRVGRRSGAGAGGWDQGPPEPARQKGPYFFAAACFSRNSLIICSCVARGTGWYLANSKENSPFPCVVDRRSVEYPNISESGTCALAVRYPSTDSVCWMIPRRSFSWPTTHPGN